MRRALRPHPRPTESKNGDAMRRVRTAALAAALALGAGCGEEAQGSVPERPRDEAPAPARPRALFQQSRPLMGTIYQISVDAPEAVAAPAVAAAYDEIARLEDVLSEWREDSTISRVNAAAGGAPVEVDADTMRVVRAGLEVSEWSEGAFDITWAALRGLYDFRRGVPPEPAAIRRRLPLIDHRAVTVDPAARTVALARAGMAIGTGGIGKGYALDRAAEILEARGITSYMLNAGGQVQVRGMRGTGDEARPWRVGIQHPRGDAPFALVESTGGSISTSGDYERFFLDAAGRRYHHIIDTDTGLPSDRSMSVTIITENGAYADALSTAVFVMGWERGLAMLERLPFRAEAVVVDPTCTVHATPGTFERLVLLAPMNGMQLPGCAR